MTVTIAIIGPGAVGGSVAAWLAQAPDHAVTLCARTPLDRLVIDTPSGRITASPVVITDPATAAPVDWVLITTKTYDAESTARWLAPLTGPATRFAVMQNGVEHVARFAPWIDPARILPVMVDIPAERIAPGRILQRRNGVLLVPDSADGAAFAALFAGTPVAVSTTDDFRTAAWRKLCLNCAGAVSVLTLKPGGVAHHPGAAQVMRALVAECVAVGRAEGADLPDTLPDAVVARYREGAPDSVNSMHADRIAGRPMELDARNGVIIRLGAAHAIATPVNAMMVALIEAAMG